MAIDSALKRRNAAGVTFPASVAVVPDSDKDEPWRRSAGWGFYFDPSAEIDLRPPFTASWTDPARTASWKE